ncbi:MAG: phage holin family protein [Zoogloeaceae bacterium]|jgi:uncharacterized membrane protein YqjE|nr:phage holin family protein [Zoogloeaceae bacterium]
MTEKASRLFQGLRLTLADLLDIGRTRLALLANEVEEEKLRFVGAMTCTLLALATFIVSAVLLVVFLVFLFWESRLVVLGAACLLFFTVSLVLALAGRGAWVARSSMFSASLAELKTDVDRLRSGTSSPDNAA